MKDRRDIPAPSLARGSARVRVPALDASKIALYQSMRERKVNKSELARRLDWHLPQVDRVLQIRHGSQIEQLEAAFAAVGKRLEITISDDDDSPSVPMSLVAKASQGHRLRPVRRMAAKKR